MQLGLLGFPKVGKTTLFNALTASAQDTEKFAASSEVHLGAARVQDPRLERLRELFAPRRYTPATTEYVDIPGIRKGDGSESLDLARLRNTDALLHVVRAFADAELVHTEGTIDPVRDVAAIDLELLLADLEVVERRLERLAQAQKRGLNEEEKRERRLLDEVIRPVLEQERPLREVALAGEDERRLRGFQLLCQKPLLVVLNVGEAEVGKEPVDLGIRTGPGASAMVVCARLEEEISRLAEQDRASFLAELGLGAPSVERVVHASYELLGLISFFTVGEDEVRAWTIPRGTTARSAAGVIHSDLERGFIRAEVVPCQELLELGSLQACRERGTLRIEGKDYAIQDGEVVHIRFSV